MHWARCQTGKCHSWTQGSEVWALIWPQSSAEDRSWAPITPGFSYLPLGCYRQVTSPQCALCSPHCFPGTILFGEKSGWGLWIEELEGCWSQSLSFWLNQLVPVKFYDLLRNYPPAYMGQSYVSSPCPFMLLSTELAPISLLAASL